MKVFGLGNEPDLIKVQKGMRYGALLNVSTDQIVYATQASESAFIVSRDGAGQLEVKMEVLRENNQHSDEKMYVAFRESEALDQIIMKKLPKEGGIFHNLNIEFEVRHMYFDSLIRAVNRISPLIIERLLPTSTDFCRLTNNPDRDFMSLLPKAIIIDQNQFQALRKVLSCSRKSPPIIINGPFGTGKTRLLAVITHCIIQHGLKYQMPVRVLVCAHHQVSADNFMKNYFGPMFNERKDVSLVRLTPKSYQTRSQFSKFYCANDVYTSMTSRPLPQYLVIVTTFLTAPSLLRGSFHDRDFTHILLDEGSQVREPEAIAPLSLAGPDTKLIIAGDSKQVG